MTESCSKLKRIFFVKLGLLLGIRVLGEVSERLIEPVSKTGVPFAGTAGSNPALSVNFLRGFVSTYRCAG